MSTYDFRVLLETVEGKKSSYISQSFVDTSDNLVLSSSQVYNRITSSISCSYQNATLFTGNFQDPFSGQTTASFKDNTLLSASLSGSADTGSITFSSLNIEYDRLLRYKFIGEKVCNVLGLPDDQWVYVDQFRLAADNESNFLEGNIKSTNAFFSDTITFANTSNINSDIQFLIDTGSDRYVKFIDTRGIPEVALRIGYDKDDDKYEIAGSDNHTFELRGINNITASGDISASGTIFAQTFQSGDGVGGADIDFSDGIDVTGNITASGNISASGNIYGHSYYLDNLQVLASTTPTSLDIGKNNTYINIEYGKSNSTLHKFNGHITASGNLTVGGDISASGDLYLEEGEKIFLSSPSTVDSIIQTGGSSQTTGLNIRSRQEPITFFQGLAANTQLFITASGGAGFVGIGTQTPVNQLQVVGVISASGFISTDSHITASGNISAGGDIFANSGSFNYITASIVDVDASTIRIGGESFTKANIQTLKEGKSLKPLVDGRNKPDIKGDLGLFDSNITTGGEISSSGGFIGGATQNTGSYDFPGAIMGYNVQGLNVGPASYSLTTSFAVPDAGFHVVFVAPKSGIVEIEIQILYDGGSVGQTLVIGLSDNASYNAVADYYEQTVADADEADDYEIHHKWVVPSLTPGDTYQYWLGARVLNTLGTPRFHYGGSGTGRFPDFIMKATALPSNTQIET